MGAMAIWLAVGAVIIVLIFYNLSRSPEWRNFRWDRLWRFDRRGAP